MPEEQVKKEEIKKEKLIKSSTGQKHILYASDKGESEDKDEKK